MQPPVSLSGSCWRRAIARRHAASCRTPAPACSSVWPWSFSSLPAPYLYRGALAPQRFLPSPRRSAWSAGRGPKGKAPGSARGRRLDSLSAAAPGQFLRPRTRYSPNAFMVQNISDRPTRRQEHFSEMLAVLPAILYDWGHETSGPHPGHPHSRGRGAVGPPGESPSCTPITSGSIPSDTPRSLRQPSGPRSASASAHSWSRSCGWP